MDNVIFCENKKKHLWVVIPMTLLFAFLTVVCIIVAVNGTNQFYQEQNLLQILFNFLGYKTCLIACPFLSISTILFAFVTAYLCRSKVVVTQTNVMLQTLFKTKTIKITDIQNYQISNYKRGSEYCIVQIATSNGLFNVVVSNAKDFVNCLATQI